MDYVVALPAAGSGKRMGAGKNKLFLTLANKPILIHTLEVFERDPHCTGIFLAVKQEEREYIQSLLNEYIITKVKGLPNGGKERQHSVHACLKVMEDAEIVLVHDAARPFITHSVIRRLVKTAYEKGAAVAGVRAKDTMKKVKNGIIVETVNRDDLWSIQTPQAFRFELLRQAEEDAERTGFLGTDEAMLVERLGHEIHIVESSYENIKITTKEDLIFGEAIIKHRQLNNESNLTNLMDS
ncbi:2-C-methyl-D-erythritol 4-phosphate cytidylyltransferase [Ureibacillus sp. FSL K6-8385]|uniref:2-C-methyl-D-erythritol 4-phosphate cytidylyltransferase n=1 Tax=Ureibacillus terrenus TaxID=118246 RepID=A0A540V2S9_9BACL|nr:2-C-methyl-D-erythritol 4-phosphate cytidylyltransferase [Ureibacillus terrenus]MED3661680.1 2-C-methyl-D-erythritol 4-phosphate cytidylyltransferase [Ureibacillus terrenus]MED3763538.1 2-C-methyl-D-erythritol 4-phosphate cytidylyltransferase [Ureibacillus terrenus]TQE91027.1 2-C-methyl-D-erythritol 4-phosphate cytidylyltransferase [Ureibacillus terrenus]